MALASVVLRAFNERIAEVVGRLNESVQKFNQLVTNYNNVVKDLNETRAGGTNVTAR